MKSYEASAAIDASPEKVWSTLVATGAWPEWDPSCVKIEGTVALGAKMKAFSKLAPGRAFPVKVSELVENERMVWTGGMPLGLFRGERSFTLSRDGKGTRFQLREVFSGPMLAVIGGSIPDLTESFQGFVAGLKARVEGSA
jgi:hypothetical protein